MVLPIYLVWLFDLTKETQVIKEALTVIAANNSTNITKTILKPNDGFFNMLEIPEDQIEILSAMDPSPITYHNLAYKVIISVVILALVSILAFSVLDDVARAGYWIWISDFLLEYHYHERVAGFYSERHGT